MKLKIQAKIEDTNFGAEFDIDLPQKYANVIHKSTEIFKVVAEAVNRIKQELSRDGRD
ncbi:MAG: hypothetical protein J7M38_14860 [Armatimonadetes bacterium]|nr:hypothetical protein [Armatimonadota bacterium]